MSAARSPVGVNVGPDPTVRDGPSMNASVMGSPVCWESR